MLLRRLVEYSEHIEMPPVMYAKTPVKWLIDLAPDGKFLGFVQQSGGREKNDRGKEFYAPDCGRRTMGIKPKLLCDNGAYVLGRTPEGKKTARVLDQHAGFVELTSMCANDLNLQELDAVVNFLKNLSASPPEPPNDFNPNDNVTFRVNDSVLINIPSIQEWWAEYTTGASGELDQCIVCGKKRPCLDRHPIAIKRIPGGQTSGMAMISANVDAFESYNLSASMIAPTCQDCAERYAKTLNFLLASKSNSYRIGNTAYVFWTKDDTDFDVLNFLDKPDDDQVKELLRSGFTGKPQEAITANAFYAAALSASGARVVVRDWIETTVPAVQSNLARWFHRQTMIDAYGGEGRPLGIFSLVASLYRDVGKEVVDAVPRLLINSALTGSPLPDYLIFQAVKRMRADPNPTRNDREDTFTFYARMMLIRLVLNSRKEMEENFMSEINLTNQDPAYLCGRLLAVLENIQYLAIPGAKATMIDRYYGTASSAPASVFGTLMRGAQPHLAKLRKEKEGAYHALQKRLEDICAGLPAYPLSLSMKDQAIFALGYYHQRAEDRAQRSAHKESKGTTEEKS